MKAHEACQIQAETLGFSLIGFCKAELPLKTQTEFLEFLSQERHGDMTWLKNRAFERMNPTHLWPEAKEVVMLGINYAPEENPLSRLETADLANISCYALNQDYHDVIKKQLKQFARWVVNEFNCQIKLFVDTAPLLEKPLAMQAGLGWQGKHTNLVSRSYGSWLFLASLMVDRPLFTDSATVMPHQDSHENPHQDHCGSCQKCVDICPTDALTEPYRMDARRCISYLTIEHKGHIAPELMDKMGNRIYGCDDCLAVCPWNKYAKHTNWPSLAAKQELANLSIKQALTFDDTTFRQFFRKNPVKRIGVHRFIRNALIVAGNSGNLDYKDQIIPYLSHDDPVLRDTAHWANEKLNRVGG